MSILNGMKLSRLDEQVQPVTVTAGTLITREFSGKY
jgi:hypothetical protein